MTVTGSVLDLQIEELLKMDGEKLASIRKGLHLEAAEMAEKLECHVSTLNRYENGKYRIPIDVVLGVKRLIEEARAARDVQLGAGAQQTNAGPQLQSANSRQESAGSQEQSAGSQQDSAGSQQPSADAQQPSADAQQPSADAQQPSADAQQPSADALPQNADAPPQSADALPQSVDAQEQSASPQAPVAQPQQTAASPQPSVVGSSSATSGSGGNRRMGLRTQLLLFMGALTVFIGSNTWMLFWMIEQSTNALATKLDIVADVVRESTQQRELSHPPASESTESGGTCAVQPGPTAEPPAAQQADASRLPEPVSVPGGPDGGIADGGQPVEAHPAPPKSAKGQKMAPCVPGYEIELSGACWAGPLGSPPCPRGYAEWDHACYVPVFAEPPTKPRPVSH